MIRIRLRGPGANRLEQAFRQATDRTLRDRPQIVLLAHRGRPHQEVAAGLAINPRAVQRWLNDDLEGSLNRLRPRKAPGRRPKVPGGLGSV